jgi:hypothetical protein
MCVGALDRLLYTEQSTRKLDANLTRAVPATIRPKILASPFAIQKCKHKIMQTYSFAFDFLMGVKLGLSH